MGEVQTTPPLGEFIPPLDVDLLRVAARRAGLPFEVSVADIENLASEYDKERLAQMLREGNIAGFSAANRAAEPEPTAREEPDGDEPPRHHHQSFAARDACESCVAAMTRARAVANVAEAKRTIREDWPEWLRSNRDAVHQQPTRHVHSEAFDCDETCPDHPDFAHPEAACQRCGRPNPVWSAPNDLWNAVMGDESGIVCPSCFAAQAEDQGDVTTGWRFEPVGSNDRTERLARIIDESARLGTPPTRRDQ